MVQHQPSTSRAYQHWPARQRGHTPVVYYGLSHRKLNNQDFKSMPSLPLVETPSSPRRARPLIEYTVRSNSENWIVRGLNSCHPGNRIEDDSLFRSRPSRVNVPSSTTFLSSGQILVQLSVTSPSAATCPNRRKTTTRLLSNSKSPWNKKQGPLRANVSSPR